MDYRRTSGERLAASQAGGREELRVTLLRPYIARLRAEHGEAAFGALAARIGVPRHLLEDDAGWISVGATRRALAALEAVLGHESMKRHGQWFVRPEVLGAHVRMLRTCHAPPDAYRYLAENAIETTRMGSYELAACGGARAELVYRPKVDVETDQADRLLCLSRCAELASVPVLWGLPDAEVTSTACLAKGDPVCSYIVKWRPPRQLPRVSLGAAVGGLACFGGVVVTGAPTATVVATVLGSGLGAAIGALGARVEAERGARVFEKHRIAALERGLDARGQPRLGSLDLTNAVLGGRYRILGRVGTGGIGSVYAAEHIALGHAVAIKVLRGAAAADPAEVARLRREALVQVSLEHPNVVRTLDLDQLPDGSIYIVMELLHGESLADRLRRAGPVPAAQAVPIFLEVCRALEAAHAQDVVHRDLKPGNVFLCTDGGVKVLDFGMSKIAAAEKLTEEGYTLGTPEYMSPEQCVGGPVDPRSDVYTFGVCMYEALTGKLPFRTHDRRELMQLHQREPPPPMREQRPDLSLPAALDDVVLTCLAKRPSHRPSTAIELARLLGRVSV